MQLLKSRLSGDTTIEVTRRTRALVKMQAAALGIPMKEYIHELVMEKAKTTSVDVGASHE